MLGPDDRGRYFLIVSFAQIAAQIANLGLHASNTYLAALRRDLLPRLLVNSFYVAALVAPPAALVVVLLADRPDLIGFDRSSASVGNAAIAAVVLAPLLVLFLYVTNLAIGVGRTLLFNCLSITFGVISVVAAGICAHLGGGLNAYLAAAVATLIVVTAIGTAFLVAGMPESRGFDWPLLRSGLAFALKAYLSALLGFLMTRISILIIQKSVSAGDIGQLSIAIQVFDGLLVLPGTVGMLLFPSLVRESDIKRRRDEFWRALVRLAAVMFVILACVSFALPALTPILFGSVYVAAVPVSLAMLPAVFIFSCISIASQYLAANNYPIMQVWAWAWGFVAQCALVGLLIPLGILAIPTALFISSSIVFLILLRECLKMGESA